MNIIKSTMNQLGNVQNSYQGGAKRVLCVCTAGILRSPTLAKALGEAYGYNTRAVGACQSFALIPISEALLAWADVIVFVDSDAYREATSDPEDAHKIKMEFDNHSLYILDIPDEHGWGSEELVNACLQQYGEVVEL